MKEVEAVLEPVPEHIGGDWRAGAETVQKNVTVI